MSFFDDASLAFLPSGAAGKDGKAYSIKPTDGTGDFTFSRGSNLAATRVGPTGLIEKGRENLLLQSNQFDTTWSTSSVSVTSGQSGYDGSNDAWSVFPTATTGNCSIRQNLSPTGVKTFSVYAKANGGNAICLRTNDSTTNTWFDLSNGTIGTTSSAVIDSNILDLGNGWYRCSTAFSNTMTSVRIYISDAVNIFSCTTNNGVYLQDAQLEIGLAATEVITTGATTGKAGLLEDEPRFDYSGGATCPSLLLEPSRSNLMTYSEIFEGSSSGYWRVFDNGIIEPNYGISPEGVQNSTKIGTSGGNNDFVYNSITISSGTAYTLSCFVKNIDATESLIYGVNTTNNDLTWSGSTLTNVVGGDFEPLDNGWYRIWITTTSTSTSAITRIYSDRNGGTGSIEIYGFQVEAGSYPTSYIPNHSGGSVTRGADVTDRGANLSYMGDYTLFIEFEFTKDAVYLLNSNTSTNYNFFIENDDCYFQFGRTGGDSGSVLFVNKVNWTPLLGTNIKMAFYKSGTNAKLFVNGTPYTPSGNTLSTGNEVLDWRYLNYSTTTDRQQQAYIKQLLEFEEALSDADCIALTS